MENTFIDEEKNERDFELFLTARWLLSLGNRQKGERGK